MSKPRTTPIGKRNIVGTKIVQLRKARGMKQKDLVIRLQKGAWTSATPACPAWKAKPVWCRTLKSLFWPRR